MAKTVLSAVRYSSFAFKTLLLFWNEALLIWVMAIALLMLTVLLLRALWHGLDDNTIVVSFGVAFSCITSILASALHWWIPEGRNSTVCGYIQIKHSCSLRLTFQRYIYSNLWNWNSLYTAQEWSHHREISDLDLDIKASGSEISVLWPHYRLISGT